jgi:hypothetical protein
VSYITRSGACREIVGEGMPIPRAGERGGEARAWLDAAENGDRKNARVIDKVTVALPLELNAEERVELIREFGQAVTGGRVAWLAAVHDGAQDADNPHAHLVIRDRDLASGKMALRMSQAGSTDMLRETWEWVCNGALERAGVAARIDRRSLAAQGIDREPTRHVGPVAAQIEAKTPGGSWKIAALADERAAEPATAPERPQEPARAPERAAEPARAAWARLVSATRADVAARIERARERIERARAAVTRAIRAAEQRFDPSGAPGLLRPRARAAWKIGADEARAEAQAGRERLGELAKREVRAAALNADRIATARAKRANPDLYVAQAEEFFAERRAAREEAAQRERLAAEQARAEAEARERLAAERARAEAAEAERQAAEAARRAAASEAAAPELMAIAERMVAARTPEQVIKLMQDVKLEALPSVALAAFDRLPAGALDDAVEMACWRVLGHAEAMQDLPNAARFFHDLEALSVAINDRRERESLERDDDDLGY